MLAALVLVSLAAPAHARIHEERPDLIGLELGGVAPAELAEAPAQPDLLLGVFVERVLVPGWLELELELPLRIGPRSQLTLPTALFLKKPLHPAPRVSPYVGVGPGLDLAVRPRARVVAGISGVAGTYLWASPRFGLDLDVGLDVGFVAQRPEFTVIVAIGPVWRFGGSARSRRRR